MSGLVALIIDTLKDGSIVCSRESSCAMKKIVEKGGRFQHFRCALYAFGVKFLLANRPLDNQIKKKTLL